jgi:hypothetical protein
MLMWHGCRCVTAAGRHLSWMSPLSASSSGHSSFMDLLRATSSTGMRTYPSFLSGFCRSRMHQSFTE